MVPKAAIASSDLRSHCEKTLSDAFEGTEARGATLKELGENHVIVKLENTIVGQCGTYHTKAAFLKYALLPNAPPCHWAWPGRVALAALRGVWISIPAEQNDRNKHREGYRMLQANAIASDCTGTKSSLHRHIATAWFQHDFLREGGGERERERERARLRAGDNNWEVNRNSG